MSDARLCEICDQPISPERLEVLPDTWLCIEHARQVEGRLRSKPKKVKPGKRKKVAAAVVGDEDYAQD